LFTTSSKGKAPLIKRGIDLHPCFTFSSFP
jgi:hypothetical protein